MHYITVPSDITPRDPITEAEIVAATPQTFFRFLRANTLSDARFSSTIKGVFAIEKLSDLFRDASPGDVVAVEDADWELLKESSENPTRGTGRTAQAGFGDGLLAVQFLPFLRAIIDAPDKPLKVVLADDDEATSE